MAIHQLMGMMRYEVLLHWRRPLIRYFLALVTLAILTSGLPYLPENPDARTLTSAVVASIWGALVFLLMFVLPILMADAIPMDKQIGVRELLDALPMKSSTYFTGKLFGAWGGVVIGMMVMMVAGAVIAWSKAEGYILSGYVEMWVVGGFSLALINSGLSLLLNAGQPTRRRAIFATVGFLVVLFLLRDMTGSTFLNIVNPLRLPLLNYYLNLYSEQTYNIIIAYSPYSASIVFFTIAAGFVQVGLVWLGALGWMRWKDWRV